MSWCRIRLRSERKMRNRNDSEGNCEVVEELRATYSERKREDEKQEQQKMDAGNAVWPASAGEYRAVRCLWHWR